MERSGILQGAIVSSDNKEAPMQRPPPAPATLFEDLWQDLPPETTARARAFQACGRAKTVKPPQQLLRRVFFYGGLETSLRATAADFTRLSETLTDSSMAER